MRKGAVRFCVGERSGGSSAAGIVRRVIPAPPVCQAPLTDENIRDAVKRWFDPRTRQAVVEEFGEIGDWSVRAVTDMYGLFWNRSEFNEDLSRWDTSRVEDMRQMFARACSFNQRVEAWDTSKVEDMQQMFDGASSFTHHPTWLVADDDY